MTTPNPPLRACTDSALARVRSAIALAKSGSARVGLLYGTTAERDELAGALTQLDPTGSCRIMLKDAGKRGAR